MDACLRNNRSLFLLIMVGLCARPLSAQNGPLPARNMALGHYTRPPLSYPQIQGEVGDQFVSVAASWANIWNFEVIDDSFRYLVDGEWTVVSVNLAHRLGDRTILELSVPMVSRNGGFADDAVEHTHDVFGLGSARRDHFDQNAVAVGFVTQSGETNVIRHSSTGIGDLALNGTIELVKHENRRLAVNAGAILPTGDADELEGSGGYGTFAGLSWSQRIGDSRWWLHTIGRAGYSDADEVLAMEIREEYFDGLLGFEYQRSAGSSYILQAEASSPWTREDLGEFSESVMTVTAGGRWRIRESLQIEAGLTENVINYNSSADLAAHLRVSSFFR